MKAAPQLFLKVFLAAAALFGGTGLSPVLAQETIKPRALSTVRIALQWQPQSQFAGFYMAKNKDLYRKAGLDVRLYHADAERTSLDMLRSGAVEMATTFLPDALIEAAPPGGGRPDGAPRIVQIAQIVRRSNLMLIAWRELGINVAQDLDGRPVSHWQGSFSATYEAFFHSQAIRPRTIPQYYSVNLFLRRGVTACAAMEYNEYDRIRQAGIDDDRLVVFRLRDFGLGLPEDGIYAKPEWLAGNRDAAVAFRDATMAGWEYARTHVEETIDIVLAEARKAGIPANRPHERWMLTHILDSIFVNGAGAGADVRLLPEDYGKTVAAMESAGLLGKPPSLAAFAPLAQDAR